MVCEDGSEDELWYTCPMDSLKIIMKHHTKYIDGNLIAKTGFHIARNFVAFMPIPEDVPSEDIIHGDLLLSKDNILEPFYTYCTTKGITCFGCRGQEGALCWLKRPQDAIKEAINALIDIENILSIEITDDSSKELLNKQCCISAITAFESFMYSFLTSMIIGKLKYFNRYIDCRSIKADLKTINHGDFNIYKAVIDDVEMINLHHVDQLFSLFRKVFNVNLPLSNDLAVCIQNRNSLAHHNVFVENHSIIDLNNSQRMAVNAIETVRTIVGYIQDKMRYEVDEW